MAERGIDQNEEKKSYSSIFVIGIGLLVAFSLWAFWDDNITRRPWKAFQSRFYRLDYAKAQAAYDEENKKLQTDAKYQELAKKLAAAQASVTRGELSQKLAALEKQEVQATVRFKELDQEVKFIKSELEEAWYEYDHAVQQKRNPKPYQEEIQQLEKAQAKLDPELEAARAKRDQIKEEIKKIRGSVKDLEDELGKLTAERDKWVRVMENATFKLGPFSFYKIPKIQQVSLEEFDRNRFDQPIARVDRCQTCHMAINRAGFEKEEHPFKTHPRREVLLADNAHPPDKLGCTSCHDGQGVAVSSVKQAHGEVQYWEHPLLRGAKVQSSCTTCHLDVQKFEAVPLLRYIETFDRSALTAAPLSGLAILACMDARLDVAETLGLRTGDAHIIRNAGGLVTDDVIRSLIVSQQLLGTSEIIVIQHTGCGLHDVDEAALREQVAASAGVTAEDVGLEFGGFVDLAESVRTQVAILREHQLLRRGVPVHGLVFDVMTGRLHEVV